MTKDQVRAQIDTMLLLEPVAQQLEKQLVEVVTAQLRVAVAGQHLDDALREIREHAFSTRDQ